jgi:hypothetical protein
VRLTVFAFECQPVGLSYREVRGFKVKTELMGFNGPGQYKTKEGLDIRSQFREQML